MTLNSKLLKITSALGTSAMALTVMASPLAAQEQQAADGEGASTAEAVLTVGAMGGAAYGMNKAANGAFNSAPKKRVKITNLKELKARGELAQQARAPRVAAPTNLDDLARRGNVAQQARAPRISPTANLDNLASRGNAARTSRFGARNAASAAANGPGFERALIKNANAGPGGVSNLVKQGDAAQLARGKLVNEGQLARQINRTGDITRLNKAGRSAQAARGAGGLRAASTGGDAAKAARLARNAKLAKVAKTGATAAKVGRGGRAVVAGTGVGLIAIAGEIAVVESVKALTGAELQDPISTTFQYGAAIFDKDLSLADVAGQRLQHHKENFSNIGKTFSDPRQVGRNLREYGDEKRGQAENITGMDLRSGRDKRAEMTEALKSDKPLAAVAQVAKDRTVHHVENTGKVTRKIGCGIGNIFKKKENDKKC